MFAKQISLQGTCLPAPCVRNYFIYRYFAERRKVSISLVDFSLTFAHYHCGFTSCPQRFSSTVSFLFAILQHSVMCSYISSLFFVCSNAVREIFKVTSLRKLSIMCELYVSETSPFELLKSLTALRYLALADCIVTRRSYYDRAEVNFSPFACFMC